MKKLAALALSLTLLFAACAPAASSAPAKPASGTAPASTATPASGTAKALKVIFLVPGNLGDKSFLDAANRGIEKLKTELKAETKVVEMGLDKTKYEPALRDASEQDWDIIVCGSNASEIMNKVAADYPKKKYINFEFDFPGQPAANVVALSYKPNECSFLGGAVAALVTQGKIAGANPDKKLGFIGGMDNAGINDFLVGYIEGALAVDPATKVMVSYTGDWRDQAKAKEQALLMYNNGVDVIYTAAGGAGLGAIDAAKEKKLWAIGVDSDQSLMLKDSDAEKAALILTSCMKYIDVAIFNAAKSIVDGTAKYGTLTALGIKEGGVGIAKNEYYAKLPEDVRKKIDEFEAKIKSGEFKVPTAIGMDTAKVSEYKTKVKP